MRRYRRTGLDFNRRKKDVNFPLLKEIFSWIIEIAIVLMMAFVLVYFIGMRTSVVGQSMSETLENGDQILVNRFMYKVIGPKANDVIVFLPNGNEKSHYYVKRVIGVPGDTVQSLRKRSMSHRSKTRGLRRMQLRWAMMNILCSGITAITVRTAGMRISEISNGNILSEKRGL